MPIKKIKITELVQDNRNLNKGTERGKELIETSVGRFGAGRSVLIDKNNRIIAGNKTQEAAIAKGIGAKIGSFCTVGGDKDFIAMGGTNGYVFTEKSYIDGKAFIIFEDDGTRYDETLYLKEDIDFNCESLKKNKCTLSAKFVVFVGKALTNKGGVCDVRTIEEELRQGARMIEKHGAMLKLQTSRNGNGVRKNAVQFGIR